MRINLSPGVTRDPATRLRMGRVGLNREPKMAANYSHLPLHSTTKLRANHPAKALSTPTNGKNSGSDRSRIQGPDLRWSMWNTHTLHTLGMKTDGGNGVERISRPHMLKERKKMQGGERKKRRRGTWKLPQWLPVKSSPSQTQSSASTTPIPKATPQPGRWAF